MCPNRNTRRRTTRARTRPRRRRCPRGGGSTRTTSGNSEAATSREWSRPGDGSRRTTRIYWRHRAADRRRVPGGRRKGRGGGTAQLCRHPRHPRRPQRSPVQQSRVQSSPRPSRRRMSRTSRPNPRVSPLAMTFSITRSSRRTSRCWRAPSSSSPTSARRMWRDSRLKNSATRMRSF